MPTTTHSAVPCAADVIVIERLELGSRRIPYDEGLELQRQIHQAVRSGTRTSSILVLEHEPVFTAGKRTQPADVVDLAAEVVQTDRGGRITWHGPGQLVCYPIVRLPHPMDVVAYVRVLEQAMIEACAHFDVAATRVEGRSGVWCAPSETRGWRKIGAVGVRVAGGVTLHGIALNANCDLGWTTQIVPCGIDDATVTSLANEGALDADVLAVAAVLENRLANILHAYLTGESG